MIPTRLLAQARLHTPLGPMTAAVTPSGLAGLWFDGQAHHPGTLDAPEQPDHPWLRAADAALARYFSGAADTLRVLPLDLQGTPFQRAVWQVLLGIPRGRTLSYREVALRAGSPQGVRAAGAAIGRNPVSVLVPCHRVVGQDGRLTGYAGGLPRKQALLELEGAR